MLKATSIGAIFRSKVLEADAEHLPRLQAGLVRLIRAVYLLYQNFTDGQLTLRAMSLVFTSLLAMVPLLAVSFSVLKAFGVHNQIEPLLLNFFAPLGAQGSEISTRIIGFVDNVKVGVLGSLGLAMLLYTTVSLLAKVEEAFNRAWHVEARRPLASRFSHYLSVVLVGPVLVFSALGATATLMHTEFVQGVLGMAVFSALFAIFSKLIPYVLVIAAFTFIYLVIPNTKVRPASALAGGVVAGVLWESVGWVFANFVANSTQYTAIYSGFAIVLLFMIWLHLAWLILLAGASIAFHHQHPDYLLHAYRTPRLSPHLAEEIALSVMSLVAKGHYAGRGGAREKELMQTLRLPMHLLKPVLKSLEKGGLIARLESEPEVFLPVRPLETTGIKEVIDLLKREGDSKRGLDYRPDPEALKYLTQADRASTDALKGRTVKELATMPREVVRSPKAVGDQ